MASSSEQIIYVTVKGNTLHLIAKVFYKDSNLWRRVYIINKHQAIQPDPDFPLPAGVRLVIMPLAAEIAYITEEGDNLWSLAEAFYNRGYLWQLIYEASKEVIGSDPNLISIGQQLVIPPAPPVKVVAPPPGDTVPYIIVSNDTLWGIAARLLGRGDRWGEIYSMNRQAIGDDPNWLLVGMKIYIPA
jgi:nucleoid-associated protein YgaU